MPAALDLQQEYGEDLQVILVESQGTAEAEVEAYALERKWLGGLALWTAERPVASSGGLPNFVLLDTEGRPILSGHSISLKSQIEAAIAAEVQKQRRLDHGVHEDLRVPARDLLRRRYAAAIAEAQKLGQDPDRELAAEASALASEARRRVEATLARVERLIAEGQYIRADEILAGLGRGVEGHEEFEAAVRALRERLDDDGLEAERKAEKAVAKLEAVLFAKGRDGVPSRLFEKLAEKHVGTKAAARATHLADLVRTD